MSHTTLNFKMANALRVAMEVDQDMHLMLLQVLLLVARRPGCTPGDLLTELGMSSAAAARNIAKLSTWEMPARKGYGLIEVEMDMADRRRRLLWLTPAGQKLVKRMEEALR